MKKRKRIALTLVVILIFQIVLPTIGPLQITNKSYALTRDNDSYSNETSTVDTQINEYSQLYKKYLELPEKERKKIAVIPRKYDIPMDVLYEDEEPKKESLFSKFLGFFKSSQAEEIPESYVLLKKENTKAECEKYGGINIKVERQSPYGLCWAFASLTPLETNLALQGANYDFSERHLDYLTSMEFGGNRKLGEGGSFETFQEYVSNNYGPVLEEYVQYRDYSKEEYEYLLSLEPVVCVNETINFPTIYKYDNFKETEEIELFRKKVKEHIMENGGLYTMIATSDTEQEGTTTDGVALKEYKGKTVLNCNWDLFGPHAVTIIGWDDNFSVENFPEECRPKSKGAYIALNSWGEFWGDKGVFYISYEDKWVENCMSGVVDASDSKDNFETIKFKDDNLLSQIKSVLQNKIVGFNNEKKEIYMSKLSIEKMVSLDLSNNGIRDITGLEVFKNLQNLNLSNNNISDITYLQDLTNLSTLDLGNNNISDITYLQDLTNLSTLDLSNNNISDITYLQDLTNLSTLDLSNNNVSDIRDLPNMRYTKLNLSNNLIEDFPELSISAHEIWFDNCDFNDDDILKIYNRFSFNILFLRNNDITDLSCMKYDYYERKQIDLSGNQNINLETISTVGELVLNNCNITNVDKFVGNFLGGSLDLSYNPIEDISALQSLNLYKLNISYTDVKDVSCLTNIFDLNVSGIQNLNGLKELTTLRSLEINNCNLDDNKLYNIIQNYSNLRLLSINNNSITNIGFVNNYPFLEKLYANNNDIEKIDTIYNTDINYLYLSNNNISDISGLSNIGYFNTLNLSHNNISDVSPLGNLGGAEYIDLSNNNISDISCMKSTTVEFEIIVSNNKIEDIGCLERAYEVIAKNQEFVLNLDIEKDKLNEIKLLTMFNESFKKGMYAENIEFICENCTINPTATKMKLISNTLGEGQARITIKGGTFDGTTYTINYNTVEKVNVTSITVKSEAIKKYYLENESFDENGLVVEVTYENGLVENTTDYTIINNENLMAGQEGVIIRSNKNPEIETIHPIIVYSKDEIVEMQFVDKNLYTAIKDKSAFGDWARDVKILKYNDEQKTITMAKEFITQVISLELRQKNITNISGIENFINLEFIDFSYNSNLEAINELLLLNNIKNINIVETKVESVKDFINKDSVKQIIIRKYNQNAINFTTTDIELPDFIYESLTMQEGVTAEAYIYYDVNIDNDNFHQVNYNGNKKITEVKIDNEKQKALIQLDKQITNENKEGIRGIEVYINGGKTNGALYEAFYKVNMELQEIEITSPPTKVNYAEGQDFDKTGIVVKAKYNDGTTKEVTNYTVTDGENLSAEKTSVTISYEENGIAKTIVQPIKVYQEDELINIHFPDINLYNTIKDTTALQNNIREVIKNIIISYNDDDNTILMVKENVEKVEDLYLMQQDIKDISGVENFINLRSIDLSFNINLESIDELLLLNNIKYIDIHVTKVEDVEEFINKESVEKIILRKHEQNVIKSTTTEIVLPDFVYESLTMQEGVTAEAYVYFDIYRVEDDEYYNKLDGEKQALDVEIDKQNQNAKIKLIKEVTDGKEEGIRGIEVKINGGKTDGTLYIAFYNNLEEINIVQQPEVLAYVEGQNFNDQGLKLTARYRDNTTVEISDYVVLDGKNLVQGQERVIISYTENGITKTTTQEITVTEKLQIDINEYTENQDSNNSYIENISPKTTIGDVLSKIDTNGTIEIYKETEKITDFNIKIATGMIIKITLDEQYVEYQTVVTGDANGDAQADIRDILAINKHRLNKANLTDGYLLAADVNKDEKVDVRDILQINKYRLGKITEL